MEAYIGAQFRIEPTAAAKYDSVYVIVTQSRPTGDQETILSDNISSSGGYIFEHKLAPAEMTDNIRAVAYGVKDGVIYTGSCVENWTVKQAALSRLDTYYPYINYTQYAQYKALCIMIVDMLNYGTEAQNNFSYATDRLANDGLASKYAALATTTDPVIEDTSSTVSTGSTTIKVYRLSLGVESSVQLQVRFQMNTATAYQNCEVHYTLNGREYVVDGNDLSIASGAWYPLLVVNEVASAEMRLPVEITVYSKSTGNPISPTFVYSVESAAYSRLGTAVEPLVLALMRFGDSADAYFNFGTK